MATLRDLIRMLQSSPMDYVPEAGVRPGYGLQGASVRASDLPDQLRNAERKEGSVPMTPGGLIPTGAFNLKYGARVMKGATATPAISGLTGRTAYNLHTPNGEYIETLSEKELLRMIEAAAK